MKQTTSYILSSLPIPNSFLFKFKKWKKEEERKDKKKKVLFHTRTKMLMWQHVCTKSFLDQIIYMHIYSYLSIRAFPFPTGIAGQWERWDMGSKWVHPLAPWICLLCGEGRLERNQNEVLYNTETKKVSQLSHLRVQSLPTMASYSGWRKCCWRIYTYYLTHENGNTWAVERF